MAIFSSSEQIPSSEEWSTATATRFEDHLRNTTLCKFYLAATKNRVIPRNATFCRSRGLRFAMSTCCVWGEDANSLSSKTTTTTTTKKKTNQDQPNQTNQPTLNNWSNSCPADSETVRSRRRSDLDHQRGQEAAI